MQDRYIIILTVVALLMIAACRVRNNDRKFSKIEVKGRFSRILLLPVTIYEKTTIMSMVICISYEVLVFLALLAIYVLNVRKNLVCYFWGVLEIFFLFFSISCEAFAERKNTERKGEKVGYTMATILFAIVSVTFLIAQILKFIL